MKKSSFALWGQLIGLIMLAVGAFGVASYAAFMSISGLVKLYAANATVIAGMAIALEYSKLVVTGALHMFWHDFSKTLRYTLTAMVITLMVVTSVGIYGFLAASHYERGEGKERIAFQIERLDLEANQYRQNIEEINNQIFLLDEDIRKAQEVNNVRRATIYREQNAEPRAALVAQREEEEMLLNSIEQQKLELQQEKRQEESKLIALKYLSDLLGFDDDTTLAFNMFTILVMFVFDPLAVVMVICFTTLLMKFMKNNDIRGRVLIDDDAVIDHAIGPEDEERKREFAFMSKMMRKAKGAWAGTVDAGGDMLDRMANRKEPKPHKDEDVVIDASYNEPQETKENDNATHFLPKFETTNDTRTYPDSDAGTDHERRDEPAVVKQWHVDGLDDEADGEASEKNGVTSDEGKVEEGKYGEDTSPIFDTADTSGSLRNEVTEQDHAQGSSEPDETVTEIEENRSVTEEMATSGDTLSVDDVADGEHGEKSLETTADLETKANKLQISADIEETLPENAIEVTSVEEFSDEVTSDEAYNSEQNHVEKIDETEQPKSFSDPFLDEKSSDDQNVITKPEVSENVVETKPVSVLERIFESRDRSEIGEKLDQSLVPNIEQIEADQDLIKLIEEIEKNPPLLNEIDTLIEDRAKAEKIYRILDKRLKLRETLTAKNGIDRRPISEDPPVQRGGWLDPRNRKDN